MAEHDPQPENATPQHDVGRALPTTAERRRVPDDALDPHDLPAAVDALRLIGTASAALASSSDLDEILQVVGDLAVPRLADVCVLDVHAAPHHHPRRCMLASSAGGEMAARMRDYLERHPAGTLDAAGERSLAAGRPVVMTDLGDAHYRRVARSAEQLAELRAFHPHAVIAVPLRAAGAPIGVLSLIRTGPSRAPTELDVSLAVELGHHAAQAIASARLRAAARSEVVSRDVLAQTVEASGDLVAIFGPDRRVRYVNPAGLRMIGAACLEEVVGKECRSIIVDEDRALADRAWIALLSDVGTFRGEYRLRRLDGRAPVSIEAYEFAVRDVVTGAIGAVACVGRDLTERAAAAAERERMAEQARHAQRLESLGMLAGGVAHDFNNLLTVILSTIDLVRSELPDAHPTQDDLDAIQSAASRASQLTRQLLAFSRRQVFESRLLDLNDVVHEAQRLLHRLVGERAALDVSFADARLPVRADPVQLEQVLVNLVVNARDAVADDGGVVAVDTMDATLGADAAARLGIAPGRYACIVVHDTGVGMDEETRARAFEPFFTTKALGRGTGLGLAMVYGIVTQSGGAVDLESAPGEGSTFRVYLPRAEEGVLSRATPSEPPHSAPSGRETVLLVEDEGAVRAVARRILERAGYTVFEARHGMDALMVWREQGGAHGTIDVLLTDLRMPELGGRELAAALRRERPTLPVVFVTGYADPDASAGTEPFVAKPFVAPDLQRALRRAIDGTKSAA